MLCQRNVMLKDEEMHNFGGECEMYRDEDKRKREKEEQDRQRRQAEEKKKIEILQQKREAALKENFDDIDDWAVDDPSPAYNKVQTSVKQSQPLSNQLPSSQRNVMQT